mmetsp:Transcript_37689/g.95417  ORF Transcript_37689/g.95417 Transcript_37689/m.95417 type:complete len:186 (-) Transcript_37689:135-692(-)
MAFRRLGLRGAARRIAVRPVLPALLAVLATLLCAAVGMLRASGSAAALAPLSLAFAGASPVRPVRGSQPPTLRQAGNVQQASATEFSLALESGMPVVVDFYADWCGPCKMLVPELEEVARRLQGKVKIIKIDSDAEPELASKYRIEALPTLLFFGANADKPLGKFEGALMRDDLEKLVEKTLFPA